MFVCTTPFLNLRLRENVNIVRLLKAYIQAYKLKAYIQAYKLKAYIQAYKLKAPEA